MSSKGKIITIYSIVAVASVAMVAFFISIAKEVPEEKNPIVEDAGREEVEVFFPVEGDLELTRQDGVDVSLSDLKGEVSVIAQFFAVCPQCAVRNGSELVEIYKTFGDHPDFRLVCITVDPETDGVPQLKGYGDALKADPENWWFVTAHDEEKTHEFLEKELRFFEIRERHDPVDIDSKGRYAHDLAFLVIDKDLNVIGKYPLPDLRSDEGRRNFPGDYEKRKQQMFERIRKELNDE